MLRIVEGRGAWDLDVVSAEPLDRDVAAYVASYLLPVLAAKPEQTSGYVAYALAAALILMVAYRADLGAINPLAYLCGYRVFRVTSADGVRIVLSKHLLFKDSEWKVRDTAGLTVVGKLNETQQEDSTE